MPIYEPSNTFVVEAKDLVLKFSEPDQEPPNSPLISALIPNGTLTTYNGTPTIIDYHGNPEANPALITSISSSLGEILLKAKIGKQRIKLESHENTHLLTVSVL